MMTYSPATIGWLNGFGFKELEWNHIQSTCTQRKQLPGKRNSWEEGYVDQG